MNSITRRWVKGSLLITVLVLLLAECVFIYFVVTSSYESARRAVHLQANMLLNQFSASDNSTVTTSNAVLRRMLEQYTEKDRFEVMLVAQNGKILASSTGYVPSGTVAGSDFTAALQSDEGTGNAIYTGKHSEKLLAVTMLLPPVAGTTVGIRVVSSLTLIDERITSFVLLSLLFSAAVLMFSIWSGMFFLGSIVRPIREIEHTAAKIARGHFSTRIENTYNDEIGSLANTINHMADELGNSERMKNEFISSVSHELRTPLTSIKGWIETIANIKDTSDANYQRGVAVIASETDRLYDMVEELLDFSRMQNELKLSLQLLDLAAEVSDALLTAERRIQLENLHLAYDEPELPIAIQGDPARLRQVFLNILDNAIKYANPNSTITVDILTDGTNAFVNITDEGKGITPEDLQHVKTKFFKGQGAVRGSGIGLAVVDDIMTAHGGNIDIQSVYGEGTTVTLRLPLYKKTPR